MANSIIQARAVEMFYVQPDGNCIERIAPLDLQVFPIQIDALLKPAPYSSHQVAVAKP